MRGARFSRIGDFPAGGDTDLPAGNGVRRYTWSPWEHNSWSLGVEPMHSAIFFLAALAACLFWTAACTAAGVRCERGWLRRLLLGLGLLAPLISLLPWLAATTMLAFVAHLEVNWFGPVLTLFLSAVIGGAWIQRAGTQPRGGGWATVPAATWGMAFGE